MLPDKVTINGEVYVRVKPVAKDPTEGHSPLPWSKSGNDTIESEGCRRQNGGDGGNIVGMDRDYKESYSRWPANRALILRAVNNFAGLVAFVERVADPKRVFSDSLTHSDARELLAKLKSS